MTTTAPNQPPPSSSPLPFPKLYTSTPHWRCGHQKRLHRDGEECTGSPPTSPIIDTPSKRAGLERKRNAALLGNSQATQPTPSRPAPSKIAPAQSNLRAQQSTNDDAPEGGMVPTGAAPPQDANDNAVVDNRQEFDYSSPNPSLPSHVSEEEDNFYHHHHKHTPSQTSDRIPETPFDLPSSPPLPFLTAENLSVLGAQAPAQSPNQLPFAVAGASPPPPSIRSLPSAVAHQISRLVLRTDINAAHHQASTRQLVAAQGDLSAAQGQIRQETVRGDGWRNTLVAVLVLALAYMIWFRYNSAEFAFFEESRRRWYGL